MEEFKELDSFEQQNEPPAFVDIPIETYSKWFRDMHETDRAFSVNENLLEVKEQIGKQSYSNLGYCTEVDVEQGTLDWLKSRAGRITGSKSHLLRERLKSGEYKKTALDYAMQLAMERFYGCSFEGDEFYNPYAKRGNDLEQYARKAYEIKAGNLVYQKGIYQHSTELQAYSPDGIIVGEDNAPKLVEIKCFTNIDKIARIIINDDLSDTIDQMQFGLGLLDIEYCDFILFMNRKEVPLYTKRVYKNPSFIYEQNCLIEQFEELIASNIEKLKRI